MEYGLFAVGGLSLLIWLYLVFLRGRFWQAAQELYCEGPEPKRWPGVVAVIAPHDDAEAIEETLASVLDQVYPGPFHVLLVDGGSGDGTAEAARRVANRVKAAERLTVVPNKAVPPGWSRRNWALAQAEEFTATIPGVRYLWLTEPWIQHGSQSLRNMVAKAEQDRCSFVSLLPLSTCERPWDRLLSPAFSLFFQAFHPLPWINDPQHKEAAASPGCTLVETGALMEAGGVSAFKDALVLETQLAAEVKRLTRRGANGIWVGLGDYPTSVRSGDEWTALRGMAFSTVNTQFRESPGRVAAGIILMVIGCLAPPTVILWGVVAGFFLDIDEYLITFTAILFASAAWTAMAYAAWPTVKQYEQEEWYTLLIPMAALAHILLTMIFLPQLLSVGRRTANKPAAVTKHALRPFSGTGGVDHRLEVGSSTSRQPTDGNAFRRRAGRF